ncbi:MAG: hypothetical protein ACTSYZ_07190 [Candidatus Helarchaeota archaeon]
MNIMLIGKNKFDSGKTSVARILTQIFKSLGLEIIPFKPHSGFNYWYNYNFLEYYFKFGDFYSKDILTLLKDAKFSYKINPLILNPVHRVLGPTKKLFNETFFDEIFLIRFTNLNKPNFIPKSKYYINQNHIGIQEIIEKIKKLYIPEQIKFINSMSEVEELYVNNFSISVESCFSYLNSNFENIIVECFNDAAYPFLNIENYIDYVGLVTPGKLYILNSEKYFKKCDLMANINSKLLLTSSKIIEQSLIIAEFDIYPVNDWNKFLKHQILNKYSTLKKFILKNT